MGGHLMAARFRIPPRPILGQQLADILNRLDELEGARGGGISGFGAGGVGGGLSGGGTPNALAKWLTASTLGDSHFVDDDVATDLSYGDNKYSRLFVTGYGYSGGLQYHPEIICRAARGIQGAFTPVMSQDVLAVFAARGCDSPNNFPVSDNAKILMYAAGNWSATSHPTGIFFYTTPIESIQEKLRVVINNLGLLGLYSPFYGIGGDTGLIMFATPPSGGGTYTLPSAPPIVSGYILSSTIAGLMSWIPPTPGGLTGAGTPNYIPRWTAPTTLGDSILYQDLTNRDSHYPGITLPKPPGGDVLAYGYWINGQDEDGVPVYKSGGMYLGNDDWLYIHGKYARGIKFLEGLGGAPNVAIWNPGIMIYGNKTLELGGAVVGKEINAGKIGYQTFSDGLDIVGAGTDGTNRKIKLWGEGGITLDCARLTLTSSIVYTTNIRLAFRLSGDIDVLKLQRDDGIRDYAYAPRGFQLDGQSSIAGVPTLADVTLFAYPLNSAGPGNPPKLYYRDFYGNLIGPLGQGLSYPGVRGYLLTTNDTQIVWLSPNVAGSILMESGAAPPVAGWLSPGTNGYVLTMVGGYPSWQPVSGGGMVAHALLGSTWHNDVVNNPPSTGALIYGTASQWTKLLAGTDSYVLTMYSGYPSWQPPGGGTAHRILSTTHSDVVVENVVLGDMLRVDSNLKWCRVPRGPNTYVLTMADNFPQWKAPTGGIGPGTPGKIAKFVTSTTIGDSLLRDDGVNVYSDTRVTLGGYCGDGGWYPSATWKGRVIDWTISDFWFGYSARSGDFIIGNGAGSAVLRVNAAGALWIAGKLTQSGCPENWRLPDTPIRVFHDYLTKALDQTEHVTQEEVYALTKIVLHHDRVLGELQAKDRKEISQT